MYRSIIHFFKGKSLVKKLAFAGIVFTSIVGTLFICVFIGMQLNLFTVAGAVATRNTLIIEPDASLANETHERFDHKRLHCSIQALEMVAPDTARAASLAIEQRTDISIVDKMVRYATIQYDDSDNAKLQLALSQCAGSSDATKTSSILPSRTAYTWANSAEWATLKSALIRDKDVIIAAAADAGIHPRLIIGGVIGEQFRFFTGLRNAFKSYFEPLKIFGRLSKFSYGIAGLKPDTVRKIESNLVNTDSTFYIGKDYERFAIYTDREQSLSDDPQLARITDAKSNYYSYLYVGLFMRQVTQQWSNAGHDISNNPGVLATLYNLGFNRSIPKPNPRIGGAVITVDEKVYTFGQIADEFYWSGELLQDFPY